MTMTPQQKTAQCWHVILTLAEPVDPLLALRKALAAAPARLVLAYAVSRGQEVQVLALLRGSHKLRQHVIADWPEADVLSFVRVEQEAAVAMARALESEMAARRAVREILR